MTDEIHGYVSPRQVAAALNVSRTAVDRMIARGELDAIRVGPRLVRIPRESFLRMLETAAQPVRKAESA